MNMFYLDFENKAHPSIWRQQKWVQGFYDQSQEYTMSKCAEYSEKLDGCRMDQERDFIVWVAKKV